jgi:hypothetical protein
VSLCHALWLSIWLTSSGHAGAPRCLVLDCSLRLVRFVRRSGDWRRRRSADVEGLLVSGPINGVPYSATTARFVATAYGIPTAVRYTLS